MTLPFAVQLAALAALGIVLGAWANHVIYTLCYDARPISPWVTPDEKAPPRKKTDLIPVFGWLGLRREAEIHGKWFWPRPMFIEVAMAIGVPAFWYFETQTGLLLSESFRAAPQLGQFEPWATQLFVSHVILLALMVAATFIDLDEQTIPDTITIPGTLFALGASCFSLDFCLPTSLPTALTPTTFQVPDPFGGPWLGRTGLWTGLAIWTGWCFALADRRLILRRGPAMAVAYFVHGITRNPQSKFLLAMWILGCIAVRVVFGIGGTAWLGLLSSLVGLAIGGGVVWAIRLVASGAMRVEAMGFGDVTLMAMIGAFVGWQASVLGFFLAPMTAIVIVLIYWISTGDNRVPFGPYLCAGTLVTILFWDRLFNGWFLPSFAMLGGFMLWLFLAMAGIMGVMLFFYRIVKERFLYPGDDDEPEDA